MATFKVTTVYKVYSDTIIDGFKSDFSTAPIVVTTNVRCKNESTADKCAYGVFEEGHHYLATGRGEFDWHEYHKTLSIEKISGRGVEIGKIDYRYMSDDEQTIYEMA